TGDTRAGDCSRRFLFLWRNFALQSIRQVRAAQPNHDHHHLVRGVMDELHSLLKRQLRRFTGEPQPFLEEQTDLLRAINDAYWQFDADRRMLEHSLELTSQELLEANVELSGRNTDLEMRVAARTAELSS